jgi:hypothetical protein
LHRSFALFPQEDVSRDPESEYRDIAKYGIVQVAGKLRVLILFVLEGGRERRPDIARIYAVM